MKNLNITELLTANGEEYEENLDNAIHAIPRFQAANDELNGHITKLKDIYPAWKDLDSCIGGLECIHRDTSFNEGFKMGIQLMLSSLK